MAASGSPRSCLAAAAFTAALFICPATALAVGWIGWDFKAGGTAALVTLVVLVCTAAGLLILVREPSAWLASFPLLFGMSYAILPDPVLFTIDDGFVFTTGALLSFLLWRKRNNSLPRWLLLPILAAGGYTFVGGFIPGPLDEMLVYAVAGGLSWWKLTQSATITKPAPMLLPSDSAPASPDQPLQ